MNSLSPTLSSPSLPNCVEKKVSIESVEKHNCQVIEKGATTKVQPKLLQKSLSAFEGNVEAWPGRPGGASPCHATGQSQASGPGGK